MQNLGHQAHHSQLVPLGGGRGEESHCNQMVRNSSLQRTLSTRVSELEGRYKRACKKLPASYGRQGLLVLSGRNYKEGVQNTVGLVGGHELESGCGR